MKKNIISEFYTLDKNYINKELIEYNPNLLLHINNNVLLRKITSSLDFNELILNNKIDLNEEFIQKYKNKINMQILIKNQKLSELYLKDILNSNPEYLSNILKYQDLSEDFISKLGNEKIKNNIFFILEYQKVSEEFIKKNIKYFKVDEWESVAKNQKLSEEFIKDIFEFYLPNLKKNSKNFFKNILEYQNVSENIILSYNGRLGITERISIVKNQNISEKFLKEHLKDTYDGLMHIHVEYRKLSEEFILEHLKDIEKSEMRLMIRSQKLSQKILKILNEEYMIDVSDMLGYQQINNKMLEENINFNNSEIVSKLLNHQKLSEEFIEKNIELDNYDILLNLLKTQDLSFDFIKKNWSKINKNEDMLYFLSLNQKLPKYFILNHEFELYLTSNLIDVLNIKNMKDIKKLKLLNQSINNTNSIVDRNKIIDYFINIENKKTINLDSNSNIKKIIKNKSKLYNDFEMIL